MNGNHENNDATITTARTIYQDSSTPLSPTSVGSVEAAGPTGPNASSISSNSIVEQRIQSSSQTQLQPPPMSFSQICRAGQDIPSVSSAPNDVNFPTLGASLSISSPSKAQSMMQVNTRRGVQSGGLTGSLLSGKVKKQGGEKGKKIVLRSTSADRTSEGAIKSFIVGSETVRRNTYSPLINTNSPLIYS